MVYDPNRKPENPYASTYANFLEQTKNHVLTVMTDDGLNRRARVGEPGTSIWSWNVITWPGYLATYGDVADGFMFTRDADMIDFFDRRDHRAYYSDGAPSIDFRYWAEKVIGPAKNGLREYSEQKFLRHVESVLAEHDELGDEAQEEYNNIVEATRRVCARNGVDFSQHIEHLRTADDSRRRLMEIDGDDDLQQIYYGLEIPEQSPAERRAEVLEDARRHSDTEHEASEFLSNHQEVFGSDWWEASLRDWDVHFLFACYAIDLTVKLWREYEQTPAAAAHRNPGDSYIIVDGGLVQNNPALPVFDLDLLESDDEIKEIADEFVDLYERINDHPQARVEYEATLTHIAAVVRAEAAPEFVEKIDALEAQRLNTNTKE
ncbi:hypothetical protein ACFVU2_19755 [Leifsonia sp. NPDC058194]|uniref:hypothetical protein n=1 Tax=Leifsonia sp. NPDC058194 TaxID=3346374 RepID=UPI0036D800FE